MLTFWKPSTGAALWHSRRSCFRHCDPSWGPVLVSAAPFPIYPPAHATGKPSKDDSSAWAPTTQLEDSRVASDSWFKPGPALVIEAIWGDLRSETADEIFLSLSLPVTALQLANKYFFSFLFVLFLLIMLHYVKVS